jgi:hypothetical protein
MCHLLSASYLDGRFLVGSLQAHKLTQIYTYMIHACTDCCFVAFGALDPNLRNRSLWSAVGKAVGDEVRGLYSQGSSIAWEGALFLWAPNVNPFRDPR